MNCGFLNGFGIRYSQSGHNYGEWDNTTQNIYSPDSEGLIMNVNDDTNETEEDIIIENRDYSESVVYVS
jgi:hypothetical protein